MLTLLLTNVVAMVIVCYQMTEKLYHLLLPTNPFYPPSKCPRDVVCPVPLLYVQEF